MPPGVEPTCPHEHAEERYYVGRTLWHRQAVTVGALSIAVITVATVVVLLTSATALVAKYNDSVDEMTAPPSSVTIPVLVADACLKLIMSRGYKKLAFYLNDAENHRSETGHEEALVRKVVVFEAVNRFGKSLFAAVQHLYLFDFVCRSMPLVAAARR
jgi:hypothetical protein